MEKEKNQTKYGYVHDSSKDEKNSGEVMTIQDDAWTIEELLTKFTTGIYPKDIERKGSVVEMDKIDMDDTPSVLNDPAFDLTDAEAFVNNTKSKATKMARSSSEKKVIEDEAKRKDEIQKNSEKA